MKLLMAGRHYDIKTNRGEIIAKIPSLSEDADISIKTLNGPVTIHISPRVPANFDILSLKSDVLTDFRHEVLNKRVVIKLGKGTIPVLIRTMGAKIKVKPDFYGASR